MKQRGLLIIIFADDGDIVASQRFSGISRDSFHSHGSNMQTANNSVFLLAMHLVSMHIIFEIEFVCLFLLPCNDGNYIVGPVQLFSPIVNSTVMEKQLPICIK